MIKRDTVLVMGSGAAGAMAAIALSSRFAKVIVVERDNSTSAGVRNGIAHGQHVHNVLFRGNRILEELVPGFFDRNFEHCPEIEIAQDQVVITPFGAALRYPSGLKIKGYSRALLDRELLSRMNQINNVEVLAGYKIAGLSIDQRGSKRAKALGVRVKFKEEEPILVLADLIIDATGRTSRLHDWLQEFGFSRVPGKRIPAHESYATQVFSIKGEMPNWKQYGLLRIPGFRERGAYMLAIEDNKWIVSLVGGERDELPRDSETFRDWVRTLDEPEISRLLQTAEPLGKVHVFSGMSSSCRFLDEVGDWPEGLVALGDSLCSFNPIFGQGITTAAQTVLKLVEILDRPEVKNFEQTFHREALELLRSPWLYSMRDELRGDTVTTIETKERKLKYRLFALRQVMEAITYSREAHYFLFEIQNLMRPVDDLFHPWTVLRWTRANRRNRMQNASRKAA